MFFQVGQQGCIFDTRSRNQSLSAQVTHRCNAIQFALTGAVSLECFQFDLHALLAFSELRIHFLDTLQPIHLV